MGTKLSAWQGRSLTLLLLTQGSLYISKDAAQPERDTAPKTNWIGLASLGGRNQIIRIELVDIVPFLVV
jgi:hypothetical protein